MEEHPNGFDPIAALLQDPKQKETKPSPGPDKPVPEAEPGGLSPWRAFQSRTDYTQKENRRDCGIKLLAFFGVLILGFVIGCLWFLRPAFSEAEKRDLSAYPELTWNSFISGEYTKAVSGWYADTYPLREPMIRVSQTLGAMHGIQTTLVKINEQGDEIPDEPDAGPIDPNKVLESETGGEPVSPGGETIHNLYVSGNTAYELYMFNKATSDRYAAALNRAAASLSGKAAVYDLLVPLSYSVNLDPAVWKNLGASDAEAAMNYIYKGLSGVTSVPILDTLKEHKSEYLYFRTDHHWNAYGAYYAYVCFMQKLGLAPTPLSAYTDVRKLDGFLGTLYADADRPAALEQDPDTATVFRPISTNDIVHYDGAGAKYTTYGIVNGVSKSTNKYLAYLGGDFAYSEIHNPDKHDGSSVLLVKESFGNALAPFLVDSFEYVYIVDYRYYTQMTLSQLVTEKQIGTVLFVNNLVATSASARVNELLRFIG